MGAAARRASHSGLRRKNQPVEKHRVGLVRCRRIACGDGFSGWRSAANIVIFLGPVGLKTTSRFTFCPEASEQEAGQRVSNGTASIAVRERSASLLRPGPTLGEHTF